MDATVPIINITVILILNNNDGRNRGAFSSGFSA